MPYASGAAAGTFAVRAMAGERMDHTIWSCVVFQRSASANTNSMIPNSYFIYPR